MRVNIPLHERYRPSTLADVVGQPKACAVVEAYIKAGMVGGKAFWITGPSGAGKTTLARILAGSLADPFNVIEIDAAALTADYLRDIEDGMSYYGLGNRGGRAWIVNEAHGMRGDIVTRLLVMLETLPGHVSVIFTTTNDGHDRLIEGVFDAGPFISRVVPIALTSQGLCGAFAERAASIAAGLGLAWSVSDCEKVAKRCKNNMRAMLGEIEQAALVAGLPVCAVAGAA